MMSEVINSWDELFTEDDGVEYTNVELGNRVARLASLSGTEMLQWLQDNDDEEKAKTSGIVLVVKCLVDAEGKRIGKLDDMLRLREKQPKMMKKLIKAALELNELIVKPETKNESSEAQPSASPTDSASQ
jgi:hypothetical protein